MSRMAESDQIRDPEEVLAVLLEKIPPINHYLIPEKSTTEQKIQYIKDQQKKGIFKLDPYFMWLDRPAGSGPYTGPGTAYGTGPGTTGKIYPKLEAVLEYQSEPELLVEVDPIEKPPSVKKNKK